MTYGANLTELLLMCVLALLDQLQPQSVDSVVGCDLHLIYSEMLLAGTECN